MLGGASPLPLRVQSAVLGVAGVGAGNLSMWTDGVTQYFSRFSILGTLIDMDGEDLVWHDATSLAGLIADGVVSSREVVSAHLARIEAVGERVNAFVTGAPQWGSFYGEGLFRY